MAQPPDYNGNGLVEQADLDLVLLNWGDSAPPPPQGWVQDLPLGNVDQDELDRLLLNWGTAVGAASTAAVPEPGALTLTALAAALFVVASIFPRRRVALQVPEMQHLRLR